MRKETEKNCNLKQFAEHLRAELDYDWLWDTCTIYWYR